jgi:hypothetical protein
MMDAQNESGAQTTASGEQRNGTTSIPDIEINM